MSKKKHSHRIFISYSSFDEKHDRGRLSALCKRLQDEVEVQTGARWSVFYDKTADPGKDWESRVNSELEKSSVFIVVVTPSYLESQWCRNEWEAILEKETRSRKKPLIVPVMYLGKEDRLMQDALGKEIMKRNCLDWRKLRFESFTSPRLKREMETAASAISDALEGDPED